MDDLCIEPLFVSLSQSYPLDDIPSSSWLQMIAFPKNSKNIFSEVLSYSITQFWMKVYEINNKPVQLGIVHNIASRGLLGKYRLDPGGFDPKRTKVVELEFDDMFPFGWGMLIFGRVGLTTALICILLSWIPPLLELDPLLCFKIPGLGSVPMLKDKRKHN